MYMYTAAAPLCGRYRRTVGRLTSRGVVERTLGFPQLIEGKGTRIMAPRAGTRGPNRSCPVHRGYSAQQKRSHSRSCSTP